MQNARKLYERLTRALDDADKYNTEVILGSTVEFEEFIRLQAVHQTFVACKERVAAEYKKLVKEISEGDINE